MISARTCSSVFISCVALLISNVAIAHPGHVHSEADGRTHHAKHTGALIPLAEFGQAATDAVSGQGALTFRVLYTRDHLPAEAVNVLTKAHGGFAVDRRRGKGETYFALPGAGIIRVSADLSETALVETPPAVRDTNLHNTTIWFNPDGAPYLSFPANDAGKVFTTTLSGELIHTLEPPSEEVDFDHPAVNEYFAKGERFVPTDVEHLNDLLYITTGYSALDYVLTARIWSHAPFRAAWYDLTFGGKGDEPGQFGTGHGITVSDNDRRVNVADRPNAEIDRFTRFGQYRDTVNLPEGSFPCDIDFTAGYAVVGCLHGPDRSKGAPIYILKDDEVVSTIMPKEDLGLERFQHIHNAVLRELDGKLYILAQAWNPGDFVILEQVMD